MHPPVPSDLAGHLAAGRRAYLDRRWADALQQLGACDRLQPLARADLVRLTWSAGMLDRDDELLAGCERLFEACAADGDAPSAAYWAFFHGFRLFALRQQGAASAWMERARRQADKAGPSCAVHGYLLLPAVIGHVLAGRFDAALEAARQALDLADRCGEPDLQALARCWMGRALLAQGRLQQGLAALDDAMLLALGEALSPVVTGLVYCNLIASCRLVQALDRAREWTLALARWCHAQPQLVQFGGACELHRAEILELDGAWDDALQAARDARQRTPRATTDDNRAAAAYQEGEIHRLRGESGEAQRCFAQAHQLGLDPQPGLALLQLEAGEPAAAAAMLRRCLAAASGPLAQARLLPALVETLLATGAAGEAAAAALQLRSVATAYPSPALQAIAAQAQGRVDLERGDAGTALPVLEQALSGWLELRAPFLAACARVHVGLACRALGDACGAGLHFEAARGCFEQLGANPALRWLQQVASPARPAAAGLSGRELQVLRLVAAGHTNKTIARELGLSDKTVERHLGNIFGKLGVHTRSAATAFAFQHALVTARA